MRSCSTTAANVTLDSVAGAAVELPLQRVRAPLRRRDAWPVTRPTAAQPTPSPTRTASRAEGSRPPQDRRRDRRRRSRRSSRIRRTRSSFARHHRPRRRRIRCAGRNRADQRHRPVARDLALVHRARRQLRRPVGARHGARPAVRRQRLALSICDAEFAPALQIIAAEDRGVPPAALHRRPGRQQAEHQRARLHGRQPFAVERQLDRRPADSRPARRPAALYRAGTWSPAPSRVRVRRCGSTPDPDCSAGHQSGRHGRLRAVPPGRERARTRLSVAGEANLGRGFRQRGWRNPLPNPRVSRGMPGPRVAHFR